MALVYPPSPAADACHSSTSALGLGVGLRSAARAVASGLSVAIIDGGVAFQVMPIVAMARACWVPPDIFLRRIHLARAFTCGQLTTFLCERLDPLLAA